MAPTENKGLVLVTGARGFVGRAVCARLVAAGYAVRAVVRASATDGQPHSPGFRELVVPDITREIDWTPFLRTVDAVVHLAARTHIAGERGEEALARYRQINVEATRRLAHAAGAAAVRRFLYMSSIKVNGEATFAHPYSETDDPRPADPYGVSKWEAEQAVAEAGRASGVETVILRPPLVYGAHVKGNLRTLMRALEAHLPLPLASIRNQRSLLYVGNLADAVVRCIESPHAAGKTYLVADGEDISTPVLVRRIAAGLGVKPLLFHCPANLLDAAGRMLRRSAQVSRLTGSLQIDSSRIRKELGWQPPYSLDEGLREMAAWYRARFAGSPLRN